MTLSYQEVKKLVDKLKSSDIFVDQGIIGESKALKTCLGKLEKYARSVNIWDSKSATDKKIGKPDYKMHEPLLIYGETGTGKDWLVRKLRSLLTNRNHIYEFNCADAQDSQTVRSELHGYKKGAFTGATDSNLGKLRKANGQILFLDEIEELPPIEQRRLNKTIEYGIVSPVGDEDFKLLDVVVVAASNRNFDELIKEKQLNQDFYYRFNTFIIYNPSLRERREDIPMLIEFFLRELCSSYQTSELSLKGNFTVDAVFKLVNNFWAGNIRELRNKIKSLFITHLWDYPNFVIEVEHLDLNSSHEVSEFQQSATNFPHKPDDETILRLHHEKCVNGNLSKADLARELGFQPNTFRKWLIKAGAEKSAPGAPGKSRNRSKQ
jgi:DNA-binding NtrC family response regulator